MIPTLDELAMAIRKRVQSGDPGEVPWLKAAQGALDCFERCATPHPLAKVSVEDVRLVASGSYCAPHQRDIVEARARILAALDATPAEAKVCEHEWVGLDGPSWCAKCGKGEFA